jgi:hypothetical protein
LNGFIAMNKRLILGVLALTAAAASNRAATLTSFTYNQDSATVGSGTIAAFSYSGHDFPAMAMPAATVISPGSVAAPAGFVGSMTAQSLGSNEPNSAVGLLWTGTLTATATDGATIQIPLVFAPKQTQSPDASDYQWSITFGDSPANGVDTAFSTAIPRFAMYFSRDTTIDNADTANTFQRYTQLNTQNFALGATESYVNTQTTTTAIKDAMDGGDPQGTDAVGRDLAFYYGWRDGGTINAGGAVLVDQFNVSGLLNVNEASLVVPEPATTALVIGGLGAIIAIRRRKA